MVKVAFSNVLDEARQYTDSSFIHKQKAWDALILRLKQS